MKEYKLTINGNAYCVVIKDVTNDAVLAEVNGKQYVVDRDTAETAPLLATSSPTTVTPRIETSQTAAPSGPATAQTGTIPTPIPGQIISISVSVGEQVRSGQKLLVLEAMKLENSITATMDGTVDKILVAEGDVVAQGQALVLLS